LIVETLRSLLLGKTVGNEIWIAITWCLGIIIIAYLIAIKVYKKRFKM